MVEIIKHGVISQIKRTYKLQCNMCGCVFKCNDEDFYGRERSLSGLWFIKCPDCANQLNYQMNGISVEYAEDKEEL